MIRHRPDAAALFLSAGASPVGLGCDKADGPATPLRLALRTGQEDLARRMTLSSRMPHTQPWSGDLLDAAARGGSASFLSKMLKEPHESIEGISDFVADLPGGRLPARSSAVIDAYIRSLCWRWPVPADARVRMIGVYDGHHDAPPRTAHEMGWVTVNLIASSRPILLILSAYEPVDWRIIQPPGTKLAGVIAIGTYRPRITGVGAEVPVLMNDQADQCAMLKNVRLAAYEPGEEQRQLAKAAGRMIGKPVDDFQGSYEAAAFDLR